MSHFRHTCLRLLGYKYAELLVIMFVVVVIFLLFGFFFVGEGEGERVSELPASCTVIPGSHLFFNGISTPLSLPVEEGGHLFF